MDRVPWFIASETDGLVSLLQYTRVPGPGRGRENTFWCICPFFNPLRLGSRALPSPRKPPSVFGQWQILVFIRDCVSIVSALIWRNMPWEIVRIRGLIPGEREEQLTASRMRVKLGASYLRNAVERDVGTWFTDIKPSWKIEQPWCCINSTG